MGQEAMLDRQAQMGIHKGLKLVANLPRFHRFELAHQLDDESVRPPELDEDFFPDK
jgi:hypothetical protein